MVKIYSSLEGCGCCSDCEYLSIDEALKEVVESIDQLKDLQLKLLVLKSKIDMTPEARLQIILELMKPEMDDEGNIIGPPLVELTDKEVMDLLDLE